MLNKTNFKNFIGIDHFYIGFTKDEIVDLKALAELPFCRFSKIKSGKDSWQGVYWSTNSGNYLEFIESPTPGKYQFGVAMSASQIQYFDVRKIKKFFTGNLRLKSKLRLTQKSKPWFEAIFSSRCKDSSVYM